ncbi:MAG: hypothetical protein ABIP38_05875 [Steroidobacteraceae bacterium]
MNARGPGNERVLVCLLAKTRSHDVTFPLFKRHVLDELQADLAVALTIDGHYDYGNPYWQHARYRWTSPDYADYGEGFDFAQQRLCSERALAPRPWRSVLRLQGVWAGRIKMPEPRESASAILPYCRWLLLDGLRRDGLLDRYDRFIISRSDFRWTSPHPPLSILDPEAIWVPDGEHWGGVNDRHAVVSRQHIETFLDGLEDILLEPDALYEEMKHHDGWNEEQFLAHHLRRRHLLGAVKVFPYVMYTARSRRDRSPTWTYGRFDPDVGHYVKYETEFRSATALASLIRSRADWEKGAWRQVDVMALPVEPIRRSLWQRLVYWYARAEEQLWRPGRMQRLARLLRRAPVAAVKAGSPTHVRWSRDRAT